MIGLKQILQGLYPNKELKQLRHFKFFGSVERKCDFKYYYNLIKFAIVKVNYDQQEHRIKKNIVIEDLRANRFNVVSRRKINALMKKHNATSVTDLLSIVKTRKHIVSGKFHVSKLVGCSPSTGSRLLRAWDKAGIIYRQIASSIVKAFVCHDSFDAIKKAGHNYIYPSKDNSGFWVTKGSVITLTTLVGSKNEK